MTMPEFVRQGLEWARPESERDTEADRIRHDAVMSFVATWEALNIDFPDNPIITRREVELIGSYGRFLYQTTELRRLSQF
jgi:hypothetical protein